MIQGKNGPICRALREVHGVEAVEFGTEFTGKAFETWVSYKLKGELVTATIRTLGLPTREQALELLTNVVHTHKLTIDTDSDFVARFVEALEGLKT